MAFRLQPGDFVDLAFREHLGEDIVDGVADVQQFVGVLRIDGGQRHGLVQDVVGDEPAQLDRSAREARA